MDIGAAPAFVFGPQVQGGLAPELISVLREEGGDDLDEWRQATGDPVLAAGISRFLESGHIQRLWQQSAATAVQIALSSVLGKRGLRPSATAGLGMGELAAATVAGRLSHTDAARVARGVSVLFTSPLLESLREPFLRQIDAIAPRTPLARFYSGVDPTSELQLDAAHWWTLCCRTFRFDDAIRAMLSDGVRWFIEVGPRSSIAGFILATAAERGLHVRVEAAHELLIEASPSALRSTGS